MKSCPAEEAFKNYDEVKFRFKFTVSRWKNFQIPYSEDPKYRILEKYPL